MLATAVSSWVSVSRPLGLVHSSVLAHAGVSIVVACPAIGRYRAEGFEFPPGLQKGVEVDGSVSRPVDFDVVLSFVGALFRTKERVGEQPPMFACLISSSLIVDVTLHTDYRSLGLCFRPARGLCGTARCYQIGFYQFSRE